MKIETPWLRLKPGRLWQLVDQEHNRLIASQLAGGAKVLDVGCGYGALTAYLAGNGFDPMGIDLEPQVLAMARELFPGLPPDRIKTMGAESLAFPDHHFDGVVLRDTLHHLFQEGDIDKAFSEIERVLKPTGRLVIFDPNPNLVVLTCRWLARHQDARCSYTDAHALLSRRHWVVKRTAFADAFALALSGGYVGIDFTPAWPALHQAVIVTDRLISRCLLRLHLGKHLLWRYLIMAEPPPL